jgi:hypothetical protein
LRCEDGESQWKASLIHSGIHHRGSEDTEGMYFFIYREIPIDENTLWKTHHKASIRLF